MGRVERDLGRGQLCAVGGVLASGVRRVIVYSSMFMSAVDMRVQLSPTSRWGGV